MKEVRHMEFSHHARFGSAQLSSSRRMRGMKKDGPSKRHPNNEKEAIKRISPTTMCKCKEKKRKRRSVTISLAPGYVITPGRTGELFLPCRTFCGHV
jgi:hypothetical protein